MILINEENLETEMLSLWNNEEDFKDVNVKLGDVMQKLYGAKQVDAEPVRHGRWINISISADGNRSSAECDLCGAIVHNNFSNTINYCPNCGADMRGEKDERFNQ